MQPGIFTRYRSFSRSTGLQPGLAVVVLAVLVLFGSCTTASNIGMNTNSDGTQAPYRTASVTGGTGTTSSSAAGFYRLPVQGPKFWRRMMTPDVAHQYRAVNGRSQCTLFVADMLKKYFHPSVYTRIFPDGPRGANDTFLDWIENGHLIRLSPGVYSIEDIQRLADDGYLILMAYFYPDIAGHVAFVGHSDLKLFTIPPIDGLEGRNGTDLEPEWFPVMVQAGTYTGITSMVYATNGWLRNDNFASGVVRYYALRAEG